MASYGKGWRDVGIDPVTGKVVPPGVIATNAAKAKRSKFGNVRTAVHPETLAMVEGDVSDGWTVFDSRREAARYVALVLEQRAGTISGLTLQPRFTLTTVGHDGVRRPVGEYRGDFGYIRDGQVVTEDSKGFRTDVYKWKKKHLKAEYGIEILET